MDKKGAILVVCVVGALVIGTQIPRFLRDGGEEAAKVCEQHIASALRSPSTYERTKLTVSPDKDEYGTRSVFIGYDADNAFGIPIRGKEWCAFEVDDDGSFPHSMLMDGDRGLVDANARLREAQKLSGIKVKELPVDRPACCIPAS